MTDIVIISDGEDDEIAFVSMKQPIRPRAVPAGPSRVSAPMFISSDSEDEPQDIVSFLQGEVARPNKIDRKGKSRAVEKIAIDIGSQVTVVRTTVSTATHIESQPFVTQSEEIDLTQSSLKPKKKRKSEGDLIDVGEKRKKSDDTADTPALTKEDKEALKAKERADKQFQRESAKAAKEAEKSYQRKLAEVNRLRTSKNDTVREIRLYLSDDLLLPSSPIAAALPEIRTRVADNLSDIHTLDYCPTPGVVKFKRHLKARWDQEKKRFIPLDDPQWVWESIILLVVTAEEVVDKIAVGDEELSTWASDVRLMLGLAANDQLMIMIKGLHKYYSKTKSLSNKVFTAAARAGLDGTAAVDFAAAARPSQERIETELVKLQVAQGCFLIHVEKTEDIEDWVFNIAADVALRPYKLLSKSHLNFCPTDGIKKGGDPTEVFELMLQEVQGITPSAAVGIAAEYPTFCDLMRAFELAERRGVEKAEVMLQDCQIKTLRDGTANGRKLNKALAKRVYNVFRGDDSLALA